MSEAAGQVLAYAVGVALSPLPIIAVVLMLATPKARSNGPAFLLGWMLGLALVGTIVILVAGSAGFGDPGDSGSGSSYVYLALGALLLVIAFRRFRGKLNADAEPDLPSWMKRVDRFTPARSVALAFALSAINPKNLILTAGAAAAIAQAGVSTSAEAGSLAVFVVIATVGPSIPVAIYFFMGDRADDLLSRLKAWLSRKNATIVAVICLIIAAKLIGDGISGLSA